MILQQHHSDDSDADNGWAEVHSSSDGDHAMWDVTSLLGTQSSLPQAWHPRYQLNILWSQETLVFMDQQPLTKRRPLLYFLQKSSSFFYLTRVYPLPRARMQLGTAQLTRQSPSSPARAVGSNGMSVTSSVCREPLKRTDLFVSYPVTEGYTNNYVLIFELCLCLGCK